MLTEKLAFAKSNLAFAKLSLAFVDVETTGMSVLRDRIIEIGILRR